ncbi:interaptin-like [Salarias fasciatus]|uniref:interaptin-like n=1 Tax=Salarias fasciatus TaxID=181472 RepID=UPI001176B378|nr:interaptin-like [Salarias fasciatus]
MKNKMLAERDELQTLRNNVAWKNQEAEAAQKAINEEKEELSQKKSDIDQEIQKLLNDRDQLEEQGAELQRRENQVRNEMQSVQTMILTLQRLGKKTLEDVKKKMDNLNQDMDKTLRLQNELEQQIADADGKKILVENYNEIIKSLWEDLANVSSRILTEGDDATSQRTQQVDLEKQDLEMQRVQLEQDKLNLDQMADRMKKDKQDMEVLVDDIHKQTVILVEENNESENLLTMDVVLSDDIRQHSVSAIEENEPCFENDNAPDDERKVLSSKTGRMEIQPHPLTPTHDLQPTMINFLGCFTSNVKQLHQKINQILNVSEDIVKERSESMSHLMSRFASVLNLMEKLTFEINCCHDVIKQQKSDIERRQCDKAIQTDVVVTDLFPSPGVEKHSSDRLERKLQFFDRQQQSLLLVSENKKLEDALKFQASQTSAEDEASDQDMSKRHLLRKMWKNTNMERQEINQMKSRGLEMRNNLEERLKVINHSVRRTLLHKENTVGGKSSLDEIPHKDIEQGHKQPSEKYSELQQLKLILLSDIEKLHIREKLSRTITTCDQANQTVLGDISMTSTRAEQAQSLTSDPISREEIRAEDSAEGTAAGFLCQLCNYCCSTCCKQRHLKK